MMLPVCCRDFSTNQRSSKAPAVRDRQQNRHLMFHPGTTNPLNTLGCNWVADCQSGAHAPAGSAYSNGICAYVASEYCKPVLVGTVAAQPLSGVVPRQYSANVAAGHNDAAAACRPQPGLAHSLNDMRPAEDIPVYVMLPLDTVNAEGVFKYAYIPWFAQALQVLALSGVHGVAVDVWWCAAERAPRQYNWTGYKQLFEMVRGAGLKLQVVLSFHACGGNVGDLAQVPLPAWVLEAGISDPDIFFTDRPRESGLGQRNKEYLSIWANDCPVLPGGPSGTFRTPLHAYRDFMVAFRDAFHEQLGSLIQEVVTGCGPCGELRYPSYVEANGWRFPGVGEFQCYDRRALASLAAAAAAVGRPEWGYAGPHDSGGYNSSPGETGFFAPGGSWDSDYGAFFLGWYSSCLLQHGDRILQLANQVFGPYKTPQQQPPPSGGPLAQAQGVFRHLQALVTGSSAGGTSSDSSSLNIAAVAAAATVAAAAAAGGVGDADSGAVTAAAMQAQGLIDQVQQLQQHAGSSSSSYGAKRSRISCSTSGSGDDDGAGSSSSTVLASPGSSSVPSAGSSTPPSISCSTSDTWLTPQGSNQLLSQQQQDHSGSCSSIYGSHNSSGAVQAAAAAPAGSSVWDQLGTPHAQALATSILQQLQRSSSISLMAATPSSDVSSPLPVSAAAEAAAAAAGSVDTPDQQQTNLGSLLVTRSLLPATGDGVVSGTTSDSNAGKPIVSSVSSSSLLGDLDLAGLLSASQQHLAGLSLHHNDGNRSSDINSSSPEQVGYKLQRQAAPVQLPHSSSGGNSVALTSTGTAPLAVAAAAAAAAAGRSGSSAQGPMSGGSDSSGALLASASGASLSGFAAPGNAMEFAAAYINSSSSSPESPDMSSGSSALLATPTGGGVTNNAANGAQAAAAAALEPPNLIHMFMEALSGLGVDFSAAQQQQQQPHHSRRHHQPHQLVLTLKIAGVHWWYNSTSHASELTAGYYNTDTRDGYGPIVALCAKHGVNLTLTCVEMCDAQHPSHALCGPEGLLRQIRAMAAREQVSLSGENALPIFTPGGVDAVALDRVVNNVRACRASPLRSCSSWPGPATTSGSGAYGMGGGPGIYGAMGQQHWQQQQQQQLGHQGSYNMLEGGAVGDSRGCTAVGGAAGAYQPQYQQQQQQQFALYPQHGAAVRAGSNVSGMGGRNFSELGGLMSYETHRRTATNSSSSNSMWGCNSSRLGAVPAAGSSSSGRGDSAHAVDSSAAAADEQLLPAMRAFTFLRLGPEILQPDVHASWMRFMHRMLNERA